MNFYLSNKSSKHRKKTPYYSIILSGGTPLRVCATWPLIVLYNFTPSAWHARTIALVPDRALLRISQSYNTYRRVRSAHYVSFVRCHERHLRMAGIINPFSAGWVSIDRMCHTLWICTEVTLVSTRFNLNPFLEARFLKSKTTACNFVTS